MNGRLRGIIIFTFGAAAGGSVAAFFTHKWAKKKYLAVREDEIRSLNEYLDKLQAERIAEMSGYSGGSDGDDSGVNGDSGLEKDAALDLKSDRKAAVNPGYSGQDGPNYIRYSQYSHSGVESKRRSSVDETYEAVAAALEHPSEDDDEGEAYYKEKDKRSSDMAYEASVKANSDDSGPVIIEFQECGVLEDYDKEDLYFFKEDGVLTTDNEEIVAAPEDLVGSLITNSGFDKNDEEFLYVRNDRRLVYYAIQKFWYAYSDYKE